MSPFRFSIAVVAILFSVRPSFADTPGVTKTEILLGSHTTESGKFAIYSPYARAWSAFIDAVNEKGGVNGRKIKINRVDVQGDTVKTIEAVKKFVESDKVFAVVFGQGPNHKAVFDYLMENQVPDLLTTDALLSYGTPVKKFAYVGTFPFASEGTMFGEITAKKYKGKRACFLTIDNALGEEQLAAAKTAIESANAKLKPNQKIQLGAVERVDRNESQANSQILNLKRDGCDVVITSTYGGLCPNAISYGASQGFKPAWFTMSWNVSSKFLELLPEGSRDGVVSAASISVDGEGMPGWKNYQQMMDKSSIPVSRLSAQGYAMAELLVEMLKRAGKNPTRDSLVKGADTIHGWKCSLCMKPIALGPKNHYAFDKPIAVVTQGGKWQKLK